MRSGVKTMAFRMKNWMDGFQVRSNVLTENMLRGKEIYPMSSGEKQKIAVASVNAVDPENLCV